MNSRKLVAALVAAATFVGSQALATDEKNYGGAHCVSNKKIFYDLAAAFNRSTQKVLPLECPVVHDGGKTTRVEARVLSRNDVDLIEGAPGALCSFWTWNGATSDFEAVFEVQRVPESARDQVQVLVFEGDQNLFGDGAATYKNLFCKLPPSLDGKRSGLVQYRVWEEEGGQF